jgi:hypothetical protein
MMSKLAALKAWQLVCVLLALATATGFTVWAVVWVAWTIRPLLAAAAAMTAVGWALISIRRYRASSDWRAEEWIGS